MRLCRSSRSHTPAGSTLRHQKTRAALPVMNHRTAHQPGAGERVGFALQKQSGQGDKRSESRQMGQEMPPGAGMLTNGLGVRADSASNRGPATSTRAEVMATARYGR